MPVERSIISLESDIPKSGALSDRIERFAFSDPRRGRSEWVTARLGDAVVSSVRSSGHMISVDATVCATLLAPISGVVIVETGRSRLQAGPGGAVLLDAGARTTTVEGLGGRPAVGIGFAIPRPPALRSAGGWEIPRVDEHGAARALVGFGRYLMDEAARDAGRLDRTGFAAAAEALILDAVAEFCAADAPALPPSGRDAARRVREAEAFMRAHADEPLTVEAIAAAVGLGPRALQMAFRDHLATTPRARLAEIRLDRARARLLAADAATTVSGAALDSGFAHLGRFSVAYRARFGESPSETLRQALTGR
jgi:AraC-like DNA-binding protein